jgi:predicted dehydrogenase
VVSPLRVGIVGCGFIGEKRSKALPAGALALCCDTNEARAAALAKSAGARVSTDWKTAVADDGIDIVIVATTHDLLAPITTAAAAAGKHVIVEKPAALGPAELDAAIAASEKTGVSVHVGFNHRYHRAFRAMREIVDTGVLGPLTHIRARYGHGGRIGYDKEWRAVPSMSGGGEAIDQGMHVIDLSRWFLGDFVDVYGFAETYFWDMPVEDNAFLLMRTATKQVASLHASWTEWKNTFSFELFGRDGKLEVTGLGGSYGTERLTYYKMLPELGPPETTIYEYPFGDDSWAVEYAAFLDDIAAKRTPNPGLADAQAALRIVERLYSMEAK